MPETINQITIDYTDQFTKLHPSVASLAGFTVDQSQLTDHSPEGEAARTELTISIIQRLSLANPTSEKDRISRTALIEQLTVGNTFRGTGDHSAREQNIVRNDYRWTQMVINQTPRKSEANWEDVVKKLHTVPKTLESIAAFIDHRRETGNPVAKRQIQAVAEQCSVLGGDNADGGSAFSGFLDEFDQSNIDNLSLRSELETGINMSAQAYDVAAKHLSGEVWNWARATDAVGREKFQQDTQMNLGADINLDEAYEWAWYELHRLESEMEAIANRIVPGAPMERVIDMLDNAPGGACEDRDSFTRWAQGIIDKTTEELDGSMFDLDPAIKEFKFMLAPPSAPEIVKYNLPSIDLSRSGSVMYGAGQKTRFPKWRDITLLWHEGMPGHHFQFGTVLAESPVELRPSQILRMNMGHTEGWGQYSEFLMKELGYLEEPADYLGMLLTQRFRAARVILDIGMHLELEIPSDESFHPGKKWNHDLAVEFLTPLSPLGAEAAKSEVVRYLGMPGQASTYKLGERVWLETREESKRKLGKDFDIKTWHEKATGIGLMGLDQFRSEMARWIDGYVSV